MPRQQKVSGDIGEMTLKLFRRDGLPVVAGRLVGVVDQHVDPSDSLMRSGNAAVDGVGVGLIERQGQVFGTCSTRKAGGNSIGAPRVSAGDDHKSASFRQRAGQRRT